MKERIESKTETFELIAEKREWLEERQSKNVKIDTDKELDYIFEKSEEMMAFGTKKILWIITKQKKIFVFEKGETTHVFDWDKDILVVENISLNLKNLLDEEEIVY